MKAQETFLALKEKFKSANVQTPELEASWLLEHFAQMNYVEQLKNPDKPIDEETLDKIYEAVERRLAGEPLAYILGYKEFFSNRFLVTPDVLIPRPETEHLVEWAVNWLQDRTTKHENLRVIDLGTGSGCIAISIAKFFKNVKVVAVDISEKALAVARQNAQANGVSSRIEFMHTNAEEAAAAVGDEKFDLVLANPPYVDPQSRRIEESVKKFEPPLALFAEDKGLRAVRLWLKQAALIVNDRGGIAFEIGSDQGRIALKEVRDLAGFSKHYLLKDFLGHNRVLCVER